MMMICGCMLTDIISVFYVYINNIKLRLDVI